MTNPEFSFTQPTAFSPPIFTFNTSMGNFVFSPPARTEPPSFVFGAPTRYVPPPVDTTPMIFYGSTKRIESHLLGDPRPEKMPRKNTDDRYLYQSTNFKE